MERTVTMNLRVNPQVKQNAEEVLDSLGISMSTAVNMYLRQIALKKAIPFPLNTASSMDALNLSWLSEAELEQRLLRGLEDYQAGRTRSAAEAFAEFLETHP